MVVPHRARKSTRCLLGHPTGIYQSAEFHIPGGMELCRPKPDTGVSADYFPGQKDLLAHLFLLVRW